LCEIISEALKNDAGISTTEGKAMLRSMLGLLVFLGCFFGANPSLSASDWPRFRGPNGTGISADKDIPIQWNGSNVLWKTSIPGLGNSSPIVWGNHVFLQSADVSGKERYLICLSANDGRTVWTRSVPSSKAHIHDRNTFASSTPATDGQYVYALFWDGSKIAIYAFDFQGNQIWKHEIGGFTSQHGPGASPIVFEGKVYYPCDQDGNSALVALDAKTGKVAWEVPRAAFRACYSTPFILDSPTGAPELIVVSTAGITGYNFQTGKENWSWTWQFDGMPLRTVASPVSSQGLIFASSGDGAGDRHAIAVRPGGNGDVTHLVWENKKLQLFPYVPCMLTWDDYIFAVTDKGKALCYQAQTGKPVWTEDRLANGFTASPILIGGKVYAISEDGEVFVFAPGSSFKRLAKNSVGEKVMATPAVANNRLFIRGQEHLFCIGQGSSK
jgi:outer membrane protein assembly factor BamB